MKSLKNIEMPHVFVLLTMVIFFCSLLTYFIPSGFYERKEMNVDGITRNVVIPGTYKSIEKEITTKGFILGEQVEDKATPVSITGFLSAIPRGLEKSADIVFFIFIIGGVFGILQRTGTILAVMQAMMNFFKDSAALLTLIIMFFIAVGGSTLGMGEEFIPLVPLFIIMASKMGYDRIYGLSMVMLAADVGFASATFNPFTVGIAKGIAEVPLGSDIMFRIIFALSTFTITLIYVLRYGAKVKKDPSKSLLAADNRVVDEAAHEEIKLTNKHITILITSVLIFLFIILASVFFGWWLNEMAGGFFLIGILAVIISKLSLKDAADAFVKGMEDMVVAALVVGFARGIEVVLTDGQILDTLIYSAASVLRDFHNVFAAQGMLLFQTTLNFFIPSGSGQAAVTMPLMAPLSDVLGLSRTTAVFAFTCGDGFSNTIIPTSGVLMAMLSLANIPFQKWLRYMLPLFGWLMLMAVIFLTISVFIHG
ncbi:MAG: YfcC family protein [Calditrichaeota bacterium]|nr:YfcC family protein [Calditrichota bacterium]